MSLEHYLIKTLCAALILVTDLKHTAGFDAARKKIGRDQSLSRDTDPRTLKTVCDFVTRSEMLAGQSVPTRPLRDQFLPVFTLF